MTGRSLRQLPLGSGGLAHRARHTLKYYVGHPRPRSLKSVLVLLLQILGPFGPPNKRVYFDIFKKNSKVRSGGLAHRARHTLKYYEGHPRHRAHHAQEPGCDLEKPSFLTHLWFVDSPSRPFGLLVCVAGDHPPLCPPLFFGRSPKRGSSSSICSMSGPGSISRAGTGLSEG